MKGVFPGGIGVSATFPQKVRFVGGDVGVTLPDIAGSAFFTPDENCVTRVGVLVGGDLFEELCRLFNLHLRLVTPCRIKSNKKKGVLIRQGKTAENQKLKKP